MAEDVGWTLLGKCLFGECSEEEEVRVQRWIQRDPKRKVLLGQIRKVLRETGGSPSAEELDAEALWNRIDRETREEGEKGARSAGDSARASSPRPSRSNRRPRSRGSSMKKAVWAGAIAALVAVMAALWLFVPLESGPPDASSAGPETFVTQKGQRTTVRLPDGSQVRLNVDSRLAVPRSFGEKRRAVRLKGEAFFEVRSDSTRPFIVRSGDAVTRVLGTAFDVGAYPEDGEVKVVVAEGRVGLRVERPAGVRDTRRQENPSRRAAPSRQEDSGRQEGNRKEESREVILTRGQVSLISQTGEWAVHREQDLSEHLAWIEGELVFEDATFEEVARRLERWYDLEVTLEEETPAPDGHLNARFAGDRPLEDVLRVIGAAFGLKYHRDGHRVTFVTR